jgi:membrane fusion protein (multidrug efflux system)
MKMKNRRTVAFGILLLILVILSLPKLGIFKARSEGESRNLQISSPLTVNAMVIQPTLLVDKITAFGTVIPNEEVELTSETSGKITRISFDEGSMVKKGELLVKINDAVLQAQLNKLAFQQTLLEDKEYRHRKLLEIEAVSQEEYDRVRTEFNSLKAEISLVKAQINKTEIRAPFDGIVGLRYESEGSFIAPQTRIADLISLQPVKIEFSIPQRYGNAVKKGNRITFTIEGDENTFEADVYALEPKIDPKTRTIQLRAMYPNSNNEILAGAFAHIELVLQEFENAVQIPTEALIPEMGGKKVYVHREGQVQAVSVETGILTEETIQITQGLVFGDTLITSGILQVRPGMRVELNIQEEVKSIVEDSVGPS